jgi:hypothetical protein
MKTTPQLSNYNQAATRRPTRPTLNQTVVFFSHCKQKPEQDHIMLAIHLKKWGQLEIARSHS